MTDLLIVGAGPAGMSAAVEASRHAVRPLVIDNRPEPGGNIFASLGSNRQHRADRMKIFGRDYTKGIKLLDAFLDAVADKKVSYYPSTRLWRLEQGGGYAFDGPGISRAGQAHKILLATGAQERPMPLPGWILPGVMGVGAAQILMKSGGDLPDGDIIIVGAGPLPLLLAEQLATASRRVRAMVEPAGASALSAGRILEATSAPSMAFKGLTLLGKRILRRTTVWRNATDIEIIGTDHATGVRFRSRKAVTVEATNVLIHDGLVPNLNPMRAVGLDCAYCTEQQTWHAQSSDIIHVVGDGARILGVDAAIISGRIAVQQICGVAVSDRDRKLFRKQQAFRRFIDRVYPPVRTARTAKPDTVLCRCEMIRAGAVEGAIAVHGANPNAIKRALRFGMGPCQGRFCAHSLADFCGVKMHQSPDRVGLPRGRNPILPVSFQTLCDLEQITD